MLSSEQKLGTKNAEEFKNKSSAFSMLPALALALPFVDNVWIGLSATGLAFASAYYASASVEAVKPAPLIDRYEYNDPGDCEIPKQIFMGDAMSFDDYLTSVDVYKREKKAAKMDVGLQVNFMADHYDKFTPFFLSDDLLKRHCAVLGSTGLGKSELFMSALFQNAARGGGGILLDAKGDSKMHSRVQDFMRRIGREDDMMFINFDNPALSHTYNPLLYGNVRQTISTTMKLNNSKEEYFRNLNRNSLVAAVVCLQNQKNKTAFAFSDLATIFKDVYLFFELFQSMDPAAKEDKEIVWLYLKRWIDENAKDGIRFDDKLYKERLDGLATIMMDFSHSEYRRILNDYSPDIELKQAILENKVIVISTPALADKEGTVLFGKLFIADLARAIGQIQMDKKEATPPYMVFLDEFGSFKDPSHTDLFQLARSAGISLWLSVQSKAFLDDEGPAFAEQILSNCWHQIYFDIRDQKSREFAAGLAGKTIRHFETKSSSSGFGYGHKNSETGQVRQENESSSSSTGTRELREDLILPEHFTMNEGDAIMVGKFGTFRMRLPILEYAEESKDISEIVLPYFDKPTVAGLHLMEKVLQSDKAMISDLDDALRQRNNN